MSLSKIVQESVEKFNKGTGLYTRSERARSHLISSQISLLEAELERKKGMKETNACYEPHYVKDTYCTCGKFKTAKETEAYNQAIQEDITYLEQQLELIKKMV